MNFKLHNKITVNNKNKITNMDIIKVVDDIIYFEDRDSIGLMDNGCNIEANKYDKIYDFSGGVAKTKKNNLFGVIDKSGKEILKPLYRELKIYTDLNICICYIGNTFKVFNLLGELLYEEDNAKKYYNQHYIDNYLEIINYKNKIFIFNNEGKIILKAKLKDSFYIDSINGYLLVKSGDSKTIVYDKQGILVYTAYFSKVIGINDDKIYLSKYVNEVQVVDLRTNESKFICDTFDYTFIDIQENKYLIFKKKSNNSYVIYDDGKYIEIPNDTNDKSIKIRGNRIITSNSNISRLRDFNGNVLLLSDSNLEFITDEYIGRNTSIVGGIYSGIYDKFGKTIIYPIYNHVDLIDDTVFLASKGDLDIIFNKEGKEIYRASNDISVQVKDDLILIDDNNQNLEIDIYGNILIDKVDDKIWLLSDKRVIVDNYLIDFKDEYNDFKIDYQLIFKISNREYIYSSDSPSARNRKIEQIEKEIEKIFFNDEYIDLTPVYELSLKIDEHCFSATFRTKEKLDECIKQIEEIETNYKKREIELNQKLELLKNEIDNTGKEKIKEINRIIK